MSGTLVFILGYPTAPYKLSYYYCYYYRQLIEIFLPRFQDLQRKEFSTVLENFTEVFSLLQELQLLQYVVLYLRFIFTVN